MATSFWMDDRNFGFDDLVGLPRRSSVLTSSTSASFEINVLEGSSRPRSMRLTVGSVMPAREARSLWVSPRSTRTRRTFAAMFFGSRTTVQDGAGSDPRSHGRYADHVLALSVASGDDRTSPKMESPMPKKFTIILVPIVVALASVTGCKDKADPWYRTCLNREAENVKLAADACEKAVAADPQSKSGIAAAQKLKEMKPAIEEAERQEAKEKAESTVEAAKSLRQKVKRQRWDVMDDSCTSQGKPAKCYRYSGGTTDQNETVARADGCVPQGKGYVDFYFCCSK